MLIHLVPKIYNAHRSVKATLIGVEIPQLGVDFKNGQELRLARIYPNGNYLVACRNATGSAENGIFLETKFKSEFTVHTRWQLNKEVAVHSVHYNVCDDRYSAVTDNHQLVQMSAPLLLNLAPIHSQPRMDVLLDNAVHSRQGVKIEDKYAEDGMLIERVEYQEVSTLHAKHLLDCPAYKKQPSFDGRFKCRYPHTLT